jgi:hypothetical protein
MLNAKKSAPQKYPMPVTTTFSSAFMRAIARSNEDDGILVGASMPGGG